MAVSQSSAATSPDRGNRAYLGQGLMFRRTRFAALMLALSVSAPSFAQDNLIEPRLKKVEAEVRALQRKVFPGGSERFFEPDISAPSSATRSDGTVASSAVSDLLLRVDSLEARLATLTGHVEENSFQMGKLQARLTALEAKAAEAEKAAIVEAPASAPVAAAATAPKVNATTAAAPSAARIEGVSAIVKPETGDAGEDAYIYGFRLWEAKYYPEAQAQLDATVKKYPKHARISHARNLLGRAYLDDNKPTNAATIFFDNYKKDPRGERAPDSLYFLGTSLTKLKKKAEACTAFNELAEVYPEVASGRLADRLASGRKDAGCT